jgi:5'-deoxynucleotidase YfbR-like HD superfamily hydrolase
MNSKELDNFVGRKNALSNVKRWVFQRWPTMMYRPNLWIHSHKIFWLAESLISELGEHLPNEFDPSFALAFAHVHDDIEIETGDVLLYLKERMTPEEMQDLKKQEGSAANKLAQRWPHTLFGHDYIELLMQSVEETRIEAKFIKYIDKLDGYGEALHEIFAGNPNQNFIGPCVHYPTRRLPEFPKKYPDLAELFDQDHPAIIPQVPRYLEEIVKNGRLHTKENIEHQTSIDVYNWWKKTILNLGGKMGLNYLTTQVEYL